MLTCSERAKHQEPAVSNKERPVEARPQAPEGAETRPVLRPDDERGMFADAGMAVAGAAGWDGMKYVGAKVIDHLRPPQQQPPSDQQSAAPPSAGSDGQGGSMEWNWPEKG
jgi:hypothetical protein